MAIEKDVVYDINFILQRLIHHLQRKEQTHLLIDNDIEEVQEILYALYSFDYQFDSHLIDVVDCAIHPDKKQAIKKKLAFYKAALQKTERECLSGEAERILSAPNRKNGWFYTGIPNRQKFGKEIKGRIYLNCKIRSIPIVVYNIIQQMKRELAFEDQCPECREFLPPFTIFCPKCRVYLPKTFPVSFKFLDPEDLGAHDYAEVLRPDKVVLYIFPSARILKIITAWLKKMEMHFHPQVPLFTKQIIDGVGYAPEPTEEQKKQYRAASGKRGGTSFGGLLCFLVAKVICTWCHDEEKIPNNSELATISSWIYKEILIERYKIEFELGMKE